MPNELEVRLTEILKTALKYNVTDIHFNCSNGLRNLQIEMRVDGEMRNLKAEGIDERFFHYLMYRSNLDVSNVLVPQTGRFEQQIDNQKLSLRFALVSSHYRTSGVLRILNNHCQLTIEELTPQYEVIHWLKSITGHRSGLFIFTGPTGSGKTTSLYTILNACRGKKIFTLEDPVEVVNEQYVQLQINEKQNLSYADGIRQLMRHDPDILMIGEIRDETAAQMAVRSALTGHLVVSSLHSFSCTSAIERLMDLGVKKHQLEDVLFGISTQRLFLTTEGRRFGIYEYMNRKEIEYYFENGRNSSTHRSLEEWIRMACENGVLDHGQTEGYMSE